MFCDTVKTGLPLAICNGFNHLIKKKVLGPFVDLDELWIYSRLQGKSPKDCGAEGMDGLNFQATGCLYRAGKECSGPINVVGPEVALDAKGRQLLQKRDIVQHGPAPQPLEQPVLHLRRRRFCIGQAKNILRHHPIEQEPRHAICQHARFSRAGIGREPC